MSSYAFDGLSRLLKEARKEIRRLEEENRKLKKEKTKVIYKEKPKARFCGEECDAGDWARDWYTRR